MLYLVLFNSFVSLLTLFVYGLFVYAIYKKRKVSKISKKVGK